MTNRLSIKGVSLLEVLFVLGISSVVAAGGIKYYLMTYSFSEKSRAYNLVAQSGLNALNVLGNHIRDAGNGGLGPWTSVKPIQPSWANDCEVQGGGELAADSYCSYLDEWIAIKLDPQNNIACNGVTVDPGDVIVNKFFVTTSGLECQAYNLTDAAAIGSGVVIQSNVTDMRIQYHLSDETSQNNPDVPAGETVWAVSVAILIESGIPRSVKSQSRTFNLFSHPITINDDELRQVHQSTFIIDSTYSVTRGLSSVL